MAIPENLGLVKQKWVNRTFASSDWAASDNKLRSPVERPLRYARPLQVVTWTATESFQLGGECACHWYWYMCSCSIMWPRVSVTRVIVLHPYTTFEVRRLSSFEGRPMADFRSRRYISGLVTLTFDLLTCQWGQGSPV